MTVQIAPPILVALLVFPLTPESPRYLVSKGKDTQAKEVLAKYHTSSERIDDPIVMAEFEQIQQSIEAVDTKPWDFTTLWKTKQSRFRLMLIAMYAFFQQCNGTGNERCVLFYYAKLTHHSRYAGILFAGNLVPCRDNQCTAAVGYQSRYDGLRLPIYYCWCSDIRPLASTNTSHHYHGSLCKLSYSDSHQWWALCKWHCKGCAGNIHHRDHLSVPDRERSSM
jgi:hypothetical protein